MNGLTHSIQRRGDEVCLALIGEADLIERDHLSSVLAGLQATPTTRLTVDAAALTFMDCSIIGLLATTARRLQTTGGHLAIINAHGIVLRILTLTGLLDALHVTPAARPPQ